MKKTIAIATFLVVGSGAAGAGALPHPYFGSDTEFQITTQAIQMAGLTPANAYVGGGSGGAASNMAGSATPFLASTASQQTGPMSRMMKNEAHVCGAVSFNNGVNGSNDTSASGIVIALDAVGIWSATQTGGQTSAACNGSSDLSGSGLVQSGSTGVFAGSTASQNWKWMLALLYGGKDSSNGTVDCNSTARHNLVANWGKLFQGEACTNPIAQCAAGGNANGALWHAFRRDDTSGTSDVFASILGLSPGTSNNSLNGFGASPYCNAMNWDTTSGNANCSAGGHKQWTGPGGVNDPVAADGVHKRPPPGTWGDNPDSTQTTNSADVLPTQMQDNDPIRRTCIGGATNVPARPGEEVCNLDGALGLVLPMVDSDWMLTLPTPLKQYPNNACNTFAFGKPVNVFTCAPLNRKHFGECPNGDALIAGGCLIPIDQTNGTSQCVSTKATIAALQSRTLGSPDGRIYNIQMRDGTITEPNIGYAQYAIPSLGTTVDMAAGFNRIHQVETVYGNLPPTGVNPAACQLVDMTDQIACLAQADGCSVGFAGAGGGSFALHANPGASNGRTAAAVSSLRVAQVAPGTAAVQALGTQNPATTGPEYQLSRKLYFVSLEGFGNITNTTADPTATDELALAKFESITTNIKPITTGLDFFALGAQSPAGADTPFCEDFNEQVVCNPTASAVSTLPANVNGCAGNPSGIPTVSTICGDGVRGPYEECDNGLNNGTSGNGCSQTCRCVSDFNNTTGNCN
jgi:cysteine-rich repeat protein